MSFNKHFLLLVLITCGSVQVNAQTMPATVDQAAAYTKVITSRSDKIVAVLGITDSAKYKRVLKTIIEQYRSLNDIHDARNNQLKEIKQQAGDDKTAANSKIKVLDDETDAKLNNLHKAYLAKLGADLNAEQIDKVKDEMTYKISPITYKAYIEEVPALTEPQKMQIKAWLTEAREHSMDAESSKAKHDVFGKYKGRINNYLSAQGYDMKKEGEEWQKRIKAASDKN